jgi:hypothetical protein
VGFVIASGLAMACLIFAALSMSGSRHPSTTNAAAATTTTMPVTLAAPPNRLPATIQISRPPLVTTTPARAATTTATSSTTPSATTSGMVNEGATQKTAAPPAQQIDAGDCLSADGTSLAACGSPNSAYRVSSTVGGGGACPRDSDRSVTETLPGGAKNTLCMDTDWEVGRCMSIAGGSTTPVGCDASAPGVVRVQAIKQGTSDVNTCTDASHGVVYQQRKFVVCVGQK